MVRLSSDSDCFVRCCSRRARLFTVLLVLRALNRQLRICIVTPQPLGSNPRVVKEANALKDAGHVVSVISTRTLALVDERDDDILADAHWLVHRLDLRSRSAWRARRAVQCLYTAGFSLTGWPGFADRAFSPTTGPLSAAASRAPADLYIAHYPAALPAVAAAARLHSAAYAFDAEDFHLGDWPDGGEQEGVRRM